MEQNPQNNINPPQKENSYTLSNLFAKLNKAEQQTFGNYVVNFNEICPSEEESKDYFKNHVSLFNDDPAIKEKIMSSSNTFILPKYFENFDEKTMFYIFYFMPRDTMQLFAAAHLYKKGWVYNYKNQIWFKKNKEPEKWIFFNPLEWKKSEYNFGPVDSQHFMPEEDAYSYLKIFEKGHKNKKKQGHKNANSNINKNNTNSHSNNSQSQSTNAGNTSQKSEQKDNNNNSSDNNMNNNNSNNNSNNNPNPNA